MNKSPFVSICIPVYNGAVYLHETIRSALAQSFQEFELLIIDDRSTDESVAIISEYESIDSRILFLRNSKRLGLVRNWNECIKNASGEWVKFIFQDDLLAPGCLEKMINFVSNSAAKEKIIFCKRKFIFENMDFDNELERTMRKRRFFWNLYPDKIRITPADTMEFIIKWNGINIFGEPSSFLIHKKVFDQIGLFDYSFRHICDLEFWLRAGVNMPMLMIPEALVYFRVHGQSATSFNRREQWLQTRYLDKVRLYRKFMIDYYYAPLRESMASWPCSMFLKTKTAIYVRRASIEVNEKKDEKWNAEFSSFCSKCSDIRNLAHINYWVLAIRYVLSKSCLKIRWLISRLRKMLNNCEQKKWTL